VIPKDKQSSFPFALFGDPRDHIFVGISHISPVFQVQFPKGSDEPNI